jgi:hypothetical protein
VIRIVGVQRNESPDEEFVLLQNQGGLRINLRGHIILSEWGIDTDLSDHAHVFRDEALIPSGAYVILYTGRGTPRWARTKDGAIVYYAYAGRETPIWDRSIGALHVLATQHTFTGRREGREAIAMR